VVIVVTTLWENFGDNLLDFVERVWPRISQVIGGALRIIRGVVQVITALIRGDWAEVWEGIKAIVSGAWEAIQGIIGAAVEAVRTTLGVALEIWGSLFKAAWDGIVSGVRTALDSVVSFFAGLPGRIVSAVSALGSMLATWVQGAFAALLGAAATFFVSKVLPFFLNLPGAIISAVGDVVGKFYELGKEAMGAFFRGVSDSVRDAPEGLFDPLLPFGDRFRIPGFQSGGIVPGRLGQPVLAVVHGGERIIPPNKAAAAGVVNYTPVYNLAVPDLPTEAALEVVNRKMGRRLALLGQRL
jgi:hypothetical protein